MQKPNFYIFYQMFKKGKTTGQIAVLITLVVAIAFIFLAVVMNLFQVSQNKLLITLAANNAAITLASIVSSSASYYRYSVLSGGEYSGPHGEWEKCGFSGSAASFLGILVGVLLAIFSGGSALFLIAGFIMGVAGAMIQTYVLEPAQINAWNKEMKNLGRGQQITESAIETAFLQSVTDDKRIPDEADYDMDGTTEDYISRFGEWYRQRLVDLKHPQQALEQEMCNFLYSQPDGLADFSAYIYFYLMISGHGPLNECAVQFGAYGYSPSFREYMGHDDYVISGDTPNPDNATGMFELFYEINQAGVFEHGAARPNPYHYDVDFWNEGAVYCGSQIEFCKTIFPQVECNYLENDGVDALYKQIQDFTDWSFGWHEAVGYDPQNPPYCKSEFRYGVLNWSMADLIEDYNIWFSGELYNPASPGSTWYESLNQWKNWLNSWSASLEGIKNNMLAEKTFLESVFNQINIDRAWIVYFNAQIRHLTTLEQNIFTLMQQQQQVAAQIRALGCNPVLGTQPWTCCANDPRGRTICLVETLSPLILEYNRLTAEISQAWTNLYNSRCNLARVLGITPCDQSHDYRIDARTRIATLNAEITTLWAQIRDLLCEPGYACGDLEALAQARIGDLAGWISRIEEAEGKYAEFINKIDGFQQKVATLSNFHSNITPSLSDTYSWQDKDDLWHHIRVEVAPPCEYPRIKSRITGNFREKKCFYLTKPSGWLGIKVTRYDQSKSQEMTFATGQTLWRSIFYHPEKRESEYPADAEFSLNNHGYSSFACAKYGEDAADLNFASCPTNVVFGACHN